MDIKLEIKDEPSDSGSLYWKQSETQQESSYGAVYDPELKFQRMINESEIDAKVQIKEEPINYDTYSFEEGDPYDTVLKHEEGEEFDRDLLRKIKIEEVNIPTSNARPNKEDLPSCLENILSTTLIEVAQDINDETKQQTFSCKLTSPFIKEHILLHEHKRNNLMHDYQKPHKCEVCGKSFTQASDLNTHLLIHEGKKSYVCEICGKNFTQSSHLRTHILIHKGKKPHRCGLCGKRFTQTCDLRTHVLIHKGKKPHKCEQCGKSFTQSSILKTHVMNHKGKKPYKCESCGKSFTYASFFNRHLLIHEGKKPHVCEACGKSFTLVSTLNRHLFIHEGKKPYICEACGKSFTWIHNFRDHLLIHERKKCEF